MTALERIDRNKNTDKPLCYSCKNSRELTRSLGCEKTGKVIIPDFEPRKCEYYEEEKKMTVDKLKDKLNGIPAHYNVVTHIKVKGKNKYIVVPVEDICIDVSGVVGIEGEEK